MSPQEKFRRLKIQMRPGDVDHLKELSYEEFLQTPYWRIVRERVIARDGKRCALCAADEHLHVHHKTYEHLGAEHDHLDDLITLCALCHARFHYKISDGEPAIDPNASRAARSPNARPGTR